MPDSLDAQAAATRAGSVDALLAQFDTNPFSISRALRQLRDIDPGRFQEAALHIIAEQPENSGVRFLTTLVPSNEPILELIANPKAFEYENAQRIVKAMRRIDTQIEAKLLRLMSSNPARPLPPQIVDRILDLFDAVSDGPRLVPVLMQIYRTANPYLRARLTLSIGRHHRNKDWLEDRMRDPDPRVRANAVEANWQHKDESSCSLFAAALRDPHHRVIGNGAVGLYHLGDIRSLRMFAELLHHPQPQRRAAGLWAVGHVLDVRFLNLIAQLPEERDVTARRSLVVAQGRLKRAAELVDEQPKLKLRLIKVSRHALPQPGPAGEPVFRNHLFFEIRKADGTAALHGLKTLQFHVFQDDLCILDYVVRERTSYIKPGTYDIYFDAASPPQVPEGEPSAAPVLKVNVLTEAGCGELHSPDAVRDAEPRPETAEPAAEPVHTWDAFS